MKISLRAVPGLVGKFTYRREGDDVRVYFLVDTAGRQLEPVDRFPAPPTVRELLEELRRSVVRHYLPLHLGVTPLSYEVLDPAGRPVDGGMVNDATGRGLIRQFLDGEPLDGNLGE